MSLLQNRGKCDRLDPSRRGFYGQESVLLPGQPAVLEFLSVGGVALGDRDVMVVN